MKTIDEALEELIRGIEMMPVLSVSIWKALRNISSDEKSVFYNPQVTERMDLLISVYDK